MRRFMLGIVTTLVLGALIRFVGWWEVMWLAIGAVVGIIVFLAWFAWDLDRGINW